MFKKVLMCVACAVCFTSSVFAVPAGFSWDLTDKDQIDLVISNIKDSKSGFKIILTTLKNLSDKTPNNTSYDQLKTLCENSGFNVAPICYNVKRFNVYLSDVVKDSTLTNKSYIESWCKFKLYSTNPTAFREKFFVEGSVFKIGLDETFISKFIRKYREFMPNYTDEEIKHDLKKMKRAIYPDINKSDKIKQFAVEIELLLKSIE